MKRTFSASICQEGEWFVAQCLEVDVASQGETALEALDNLREALELHFEPPVALSYQEPEKLRQDRAIAAFDSFSWAFGQELEQRGITEEDLLREIKATQENG
jgi:predicted RNase H-like HicB family nuclease